jgi:hypothetical protein
MNRAKWHDISLVNANAVEDRQRFIFFSGVAAESALTLSALEIPQVISAQPSGHLCHLIHSTGLS